MLARFAVPLRSFVLAGALACLFIGCPGNRLTKANVNEVVDGMSKKQVESILGPPTSVDTKDFASQKKTVYLYTQGKESVTVVFRDDKMQSKDSTLSE